MAERHVNEYLGIIYSAYLLNKFPMPSEESQKAFACGFADGVAWIIKRSQKLGISIPDGDLFVTDVIERVMGRK